MDKEQREKGIELSYKILKLINGYDINLIWSSLIFILSFMHKEEPNNATPEYTADNIKEKFLKNYYEMCEKDK